LLYPAGEKEKGPGVRPGRLVLVTRLY